MIPPSLLSKIREDHVRRYSNYLEAKSSGSPFGRAVNVPETTRYLRIWEGMQDKTYEELTPIERGEVNDALAEGSYDDQLRELGLDPDRLFDVEE